MLYGAIKKDDFNEKLDEIDIYKGVTTQDIENRTRRFIGYAAAVINLERINGIN